MLRKQETILTKISMAHCRSTHSYLLDRSPLTHCDLCNRQMSVKHLLLECTQYTRTLYKEMLLQAEMLKDKM